MMSENDSETRGKLKVLLGYAAGVGKTYQMLEEGRQLKARGSDVVVGYFEPHGRQYTMAKAEGLEFIPRRKVEYRGTVFEEMDTEAVISRHPQVCLVDEFAHTNVPGSAHAKRWEDVLSLLDAGIDVITNMNIQHLESLNDQVFQMTGVRVRETVPDWVIKQADQVVMIDLTPRALLNRLERGVVYAPDKASKAIANFFRESNLVALRELALRQTAHEVDIREVDPDQFRRSARSGGPEAQSEERILVHITEHPATALLIRRAWRISEFLQADCVAVYVRSSAAKAGSEAIEKHLRFARDLHIETRVIEGEDEAESLVEFARLNKVTQIYIARPQYRRPQRIFTTNLVHRIVRLAPDMRLTIVAERPVPHG
jgi:two-component system, OmpR family, sensor histidine kinase KdpD